MARIVYGVSPVGLGHATRAVAVGQKLIAGGADVEFVTGGPALNCLVDNGFKVVDAVSEPVPKVKDGEMKNALGWYLDYWRGFGRTKKSVRAILDRVKPDVVVGDEEFSCVSLALERGIPHALITDELELGFARTWLARRVEKRVSAWYSRLQRAVSLMIIPEDGADTGNKRYVGPIVRSATKTRAQVVEDYGLPKEKQLLVVALSGSGIGSHLLDGTRRALASIPDSVLVVMGNRGKNLTAERVFDIGVVRDGQNLVAAADVVVSTAGKSTIDEATSFGTPIVAIPIRNHSEQLKNASAIGYSPDDLVRLPELIAQKIGRRQEKRNFDGALDAAKQIGSLQRA